MLLIPGFLAGDWSMSVMSGWLRRLGYRPFGSGLRVNQYASEATVAMLTRRLHAAHHTCGAPVTVIGHSRGGTPRRRARAPPARAGAPGDHAGLADRRPVRGEPADACWRCAPSGAATGCRRAGRSPTSPRFERDLAARITVPTTSIYSRSDAVVDWRACVRPDVEAVAVPGSHVGLATNRAVYRVIAGLLPSVDAAAAESS